jgi:pSer/pThr/pTyr-binding forkhead associated (FHA) protein
MSARILLTATTGSLRGQEFVFTGWTVCTVGRAADCLLRIPGDPSSITVSRRHCLLEIDPPIVRVCDLDSLNDTYVNGRPIGQRVKGVASWMPAGSAAEPVEVHDGDRLVIGSIEFLVTICCGLENGKSSTRTPKEQVEAPAYQTVCG